jgi:hypothetical protein
MFDFLMNFECVESYANFLGEGYLKSVIMY